MKEIPFEELLAEAQKYSIYGVSYWELHYGLAGVSTVIDPKEVGVYFRHLPEKERDRREIKNEQVPMKTVYPKKIEREVLETIKKRPLAFNGANLCDPTRTIHYTWNRKVKCLCGCVFNMETEITNRETKMKRIEPVETRYCPNPECLPQDNGEFIRRKWIYLGDLINGFCRCPR